jgi:energy-converting hydrogenase Eha subunit A
MIKAEFFIQLIGAAFFLILNIYLAKKGFSDPEIANFISYRFLAVMLLAFPLGIYIKGKPLKPFFMIGGLGVPIVAIVLILLVHYGWYQYLPALFILWGVVFTLFQVCSLPYLMRNTIIENQSHAISLNYATNSFGTIFSGFIIFGAGQFMREFDEGKILLGISILGFIGVYYLLKMKVDVVESVKERLQWKSYDWVLLMKAIFPTLIIAVGAGLTIPFINLFFFHNFQIDSSGFAVIGGIASILVAILSLLVPNLKSRLGFQKGITYVQTIAVIALVALATTEFFKDYWWGLPLAIMCYWVRTPLMNMAAPMTSELTMNYVGAKNQEMLSAIIAAMWSGSWFFSSQIFRFLKAEGLPYAHIFYITAVLYAFGVFMYSLLIKDYERREAKKDK